MIRRRMEWLSLVALVLGAGAGGGGCGIADFLGFGGKAEPLDVCQRDIPALLALNNNPKTCQVTADCPVGSFCDPVRSVCEWECTADSECGTDCSCDGLCQYPGETLPPGVDPSCPRSLELLAHVKEAKRVCSHNDRCPLGSHLSAAGYCDFECGAADTPPCAVGEVCDCSGVCVMSAGIPSSPPPSLLEPGTALPLLSVLAPDIYVIQLRPELDPPAISGDPPNLPIIATWKEQRIDLQVERPTVEDPAEKLAWPTVHVLGSHQQEIETVLDENDQEVKKTNNRWTVLVCCGAPAEDVAPGSLEVCRATDLDGDGDVEFDSTHWAIECTISSAVLEKKSVLPDGSTKDHVETGIMVRPADDSMSNDPWSVYFSAANVANNVPLKVNVHAIVPKTTDPATPVAPPVDGVYHGTVTLGGQMVSVDPAAVPSVPAQPLAIPVRAIVHGDELELLDDFGLLGPKGKIHAGAVAPTIMMLASNDATAGFVSGEVVATVTNTPDTFGDLASPVDEFGGRSGQLTYTLEQMSPMAGKYIFSWDYQLDRTGDIVGCTTDSGCIEAGFDRCDNTKWSTPICIWDEPWASDVLGCADDATCTAAGYARCDTLRVPAICVDSDAAAGGTSRFITHDLAPKWYERFLSHAPSGYYPILPGATPDPYFFPLFEPDTEYLNAFLSLYVKDSLYDASRGFASRTLDTHTQVAISLPPALHGDGYALCLRDFAKYVAWIDAQKIGAYDINIPSASTPSCGLLYPFGPSLDGVTFVRDFVFWAPCIDAASTTSILDANDNILTTIENAPGAANAGTCKRVYWNYLAATGQTELTLAYNAFLTTRCANSAKTIVLQKGYPTVVASDTHAIYRCPFREALFGKTDDLLAVSRLVSHDSANSGRVALGSSLLSHNALPLSGDLATMDNRAPRGVGLATYEDHLNLSHDTSIGSSGMLAKCMEE
ncbi:MAG: hypothetical protein V2A73_00180, partial [Pseudomonadota bacterium]